MALPVLAAVGAEVGSRALKPGTDAVKSVYNRAMAPVDTSMKAISSFRKNVQKRMGVEFDEDGKKKSKKDKGPMAVDMSPVVDALKTTNGLLQSLVDQGTDAAQARAKAAADAKVAATADAFDEPVVDLAGGDDNQDGTRISQGAMKGFGAVTGVFKKIGKFVGKIALLGAVATIGFAAMLKFFESDLFVKIKDYFVDKWPKIKERFVGLFDAFVGLFDGVSEAFGKIFEGDLLGGAGGLAASVGNFFLKIGDFLVGSVADLLGLEAGENPVSDAFNKVIDSVVGFATGIKEFFTETIPNKFYEIIDAIVSKIPGPLRKLLGIQTADEIKQDAMSRKIAADSAAALSPDEAREFSRKTGKVYGEGETVAQKALEKMTAEGEGQLEIDESTATNRRQKGRLTKVKRMLNEGRIDAGEALARLQDVGIDAKIAGGQRLAAGGGAAAARTGEIGQMSTDGSTEKPNINIITADNSVTSQGGDVSVVAGATSKPDPM